MNDVIESNPWRGVVEFWFPEGRSLEVDAKTHGYHWFWRMRGGADDEIIARFSKLTEQGAQGELDHWVDHPEGRLALIIVLDQFSRSVWRDTPRAYAQDKAALSLAMEGLANGHYSSLETPWFKVVHGLPLGHCEGPDHLDRVELLIKLRKAIAHEAPDHLKPIYQRLVKQAEDVHKVIAAFGRHPHRNDVLGRSMLDAEKTYVTEGRFPHLRAFQR